MTRKKECNNIKLIPVSLNKEGSGVMQKTVEVKKNEDLYFILEENEGKSISKFPTQKFDIKIEAYYPDAQESKKFVKENPELLAKNDECEHWMKTSLSNKEKKSFEKAAMKQYDAHILSKLTDADFEKGDIYNHNFIKSVKSGVTYKIHFIHKETGNNSVIFISVKTRRIILFPIIIATTCTAIAIPYLIKSQHPSPEPDITTRVTINDSEETVSYKNNIIVFPSNLTNIIVTEKEPYYLFRNNSVNKVYFHYYIYDYASKETIDVGQIEPTDEFAIKFNMLNFFTVGTHEVRLDIKTFKDKEETIEKHPMSYKCKIIIQ